MSLMEKIRTYEGLYEEYIDALQRIQDLRSLLSKSEFQIVGLTAELRKLEKEQQNDNK